MKNIIITFQNELNYGAILQAYALQNFNNRYNNTDIMNLNFKNQKNSILHNILSLKKRYNFSKFKKRYLKLTKKISTKCDFYHLIKKYDNIIVGSDQVWAIDIIKNYEDYFFVNFDVKNAKKISYAASFGNDNNLLENKNMIIPFLKKFNTISIRESSSQKILKEMGIYSKNVIDPTLLLTAEDYIKNFDLKVIEKKYILVYMLVIDNELIELVNTLNKILDLDIICFNNRNRFGKRCKCIPNCSPKEFLKYFYNASFIVTNSFHGTCFSIIFNKKFISVIHKTKGIRQKNLLEQAGLEDRIYNSKQNINYYITNDINIKNEFQKHIDESKKFLESINQKK